VKLTGALAAAVTPLRDGGTRLDEDAFAPYVEFLADGGLDGLLALGSTGEGILLSPPERRRAGELFVEAARGRLQVAVHAGAQTTADTVALAQHAREIGSDAVATIGPPYYPLDEAELIEHFSSAAEAAAPLPFYLYEFRARAGYSIPLAVIRELRERAPNLVGMKVSNKPFESLLPYLLDGLDVFVGAEELGARGLAAGAAGVVSGVAAAFPERVAALVGGDPAGGGAAEARAGLERFPFQAALKRVLSKRGVPIREDVRPPLRGLTDDERRELDAWLESS
jgi:dihydrodipicolinate synthase/N-acetylneuraminate lyase